MRSPPAPVQAILWDIDGTLLDSEPWHYRCTVDVCRDHGYDLSDQEFAAALGIGFPEFFARLDAARPMPLTFAAWVGAITDRYLEILAGVAPREGAFALVDAFAARGLRQVCVSNSGRRVVDANIGAIVNAMGRQPFEFSVSRDDVTKGKPDPEPYRLAAHRLGLEPGVCAVIEDSPTGARAAKAAGMLTVAWPQHAGLEFDADHVVGHPGDLDWDALCGRVPAQ